LLVVLHVHRRTTRQFNADVRLFEEQLAIALGERSKLQRQTAAMKRDAELTWTAGRVESALFRERINDVIYEIDRITEAIESSGLSIGSTSAYAAPVPEDGRGTQRVNGVSNEASAETTNTGALADRIRALRTAASRAR
jgi:hypothetical protein